MNKYEALAQNAAQVVNPVQGSYFIYNPEYGYKRFRYMIIESDGLTRAVPVAGEIEAANKPQHRQGALEQWVRDGRPERARL